MKKLLIGAIVGGILIFLWQFLSWTILNLHGSMATYTPKQDSVMNYLNTQFSEDGFYMLPGYKPGTTHEEMEKQMKECEGKPWVQLYYHKSMNMNMVTNMVRGLFTNIVMVALLCWLLMKINAPGFGTILIGSLLVGFIGYLNIAYTYHIWYQTADITAYLTDTLVSWGLAGVWLGWWLRRK
ncbi:MAG TPA: hypothetical protein VLD19_18490 [Chitinophagaceae bacterium]|nr:hypothetical protein [Chitinophagaceae bacterium]